MVIRSVGTSGQPILPLLDNAYAILLCVAALLPCHCIYHVSAAFWGYLSE